MMQISVEEAEIGMEVVINYYTQKRSLLSLRCYIREIYDNSFTVNMGHSEFDNRGIDKESVNKIICLSKLYDCDLGV